MFRAFSSACARGAWLLLVSASTASVLAGQTLRAPEVGAQPVGAQAVGTQAVGTQAGGTQAVGTQAMVPQAASQTVPSAPTPASASVSQLAQRVDSLRRTDDGRATDARALGAALGALADAQEGNGEIASAIVTVREQLHLAEGLRDSAAIAQSHNAIGMLHWRANRYDSALVHLELARILREAIHDRAGLARVLNNIGSTHYQFAQYEPALDAFAQSLAVRRELNDARGVALVLSNIGLAYNDFGQLARAQTVLEEAIAVATEISDQTVTGYARHTLGTVLLERGDLAGARAQFERSLAVYRAAARNRTDSLSGWSINTLSLGLLNVKEGRPRDAIARLDSVARVAQEGGSVRGQARALLYLGEAYHALGDHQRAVDALSRSLALSNGIHQRLLAMDALQQLVTVEEDAGNARKALDHLRAHQALRDSVFDEASAKRLVAMETAAASARQLQENERLRSAQREQALIIERQRLAGSLGVVILLLAIGVVSLLILFLRTGRAREALLARTNADLAVANQELRTALADVRTLKGLIPICANCKKVRDDSGFWGAVETYITSRSDATFSHAICASCGPELYGEHWEPTPEPVAGTPECARPSGQRASTIV